MPIVRIISGAQPGVAQGGIDAALYCKLPYGGWIPKGRQYESNVIPLRYRELIESASEDPDEHIALNIRNSDCTLVFRCGEPKDMVLQTLALAEMHRRPRLSIDLTAVPRVRAVTDIMKWLEGATEPPSDLIPIPENVVLHVAGSCESKAEGIQEMVTSILVDVLRKANRECCRHRPFPLAMGWA